MPSRPSSACEVTGNGQIRRLPTFRSEINLITPGNPKAAASLVKEGVSVSMALDAAEVKSLDHIFAAGGV